MLIVNLSFTFFTFVSRNSLSVVPTVKECDRALLAEDTRAALVGTWGVTC